MTKESHCLKILKNIYGGKESGKVWFEHLKTVLTTTMKYTQSKFDECIFFKDLTIFFIYTDDGIFVDPDPKTVSRRIHELSTVFEIENQGNLHEYLGIKIVQAKEGLMTMSQPHLINSILKDLNLVDESMAPRKGVKLKNLPSLTSRQIGPDTDGAPLDAPWHYRSIIGKLNFLEKSTRPDISFVVHQLARFVTNPKQSHGHAIKHLARYLLGTRDKGIVFNPNPPLSLTCHVNADFAGNWNHKEAPNNADTARSRSGFIVFFAGAPLFWQSKLQTVISLSTAESELIALSEASRFVKSMMYLIDELNDQGIEASSLPEVYCNIFEDNAAALEISKVPKVRPRTRHINVLYHHFRAEVQNNRVKIHPIKTDENLADVLTKQQAASLFMRHRKEILGW